MDERLEILKQLESGDITAAEAEALLDAIESQKAEEARAGLEALRDECIALRDDCREHREQAEAFADKAKQSSEQAGKHAENARDSADEAEEFAEEAEEHAGEAEGHAEEAGSRADKNTTDSTMNERQWQAFTDSMNTVEQTLGMVQDMLQSLGIQGVNLKDQFRQSMEKAKTAAGRGMQKPVAKPGRTTHAAPGKARIRATMWY